MTRKKIFTTLLLVGIPILLSAQFEQKFSLNFSLGMVYPYGPKEYIKPGVALTDDYFTGYIAQLRPYLMANFKPGGSLYGGIQINYSRRFSTAFSIQLFRILNWEYNYQWEFTNLDQSIEGSWMEWQIRESDLDPVNGSYDEIVESGENKLSLTNIGISAAPKLYAFPGRMINPYLFGEVSYNITNLALKNNYGRAINRYNIEGIEYEPYVEILEQNIGFGFYPGIGFEIRANENLGLFVQGGYSLIFIPNQKLQDAGHADENFTNLRAEAGIKISFLRSKNL